jgi:hypothetical protein
LSGPMRAGLELAPGASARLSGGQFSVPAAAILVGDEGQLEAASNIILRAGRSPVPPPIRVGDGAQVTLRQNVFVGYGIEVVKGVSAAERQQILGANVIVNAEPPR